MKLFDLQLFTDENTVDVATLTDHFTEEELQEVIPKEEIPQQEQQEEQHEEPTPEPAPDSDKVSNHVPYERFKEVNDKYKALKAEVEALKDKPQPQPTYQPQPQPQQQEPPINIEEAADRKVRSDLQIGDVDLYELQVNDPAKFQKYLKEVAKTEMKMEAALYSYQRVTSENNAFIHELQNTPNVDVLLRFAEQELDEMPLSKARPLDTAIERLRKMQANSEDIALLRKYVVDCQEKLNKINEAPEATPQGAISMPSKLAQVQDLPKVNPGGGAKPAAPNWADIEKLASTGQFDKIPKEILEQIDPKLLE